MLSTGHVDCWGENDVGQLGDGNEEYSDIPVEVRGIANATEVTAGGGHSCALLSTSHIDCWGQNRFGGQLGDGSEENSDVPVEVRGVSDATGVTAGYGHSCALLSTGHIDCWGENGVGELGDGSEEGSDIPVEVHAVSNATEVVAGGYYTCALLSTGHVECWGINYEGELGDGLAFSEVPTEVLGLDPEELSGSGPSSPSAVTGGASSVTQTSATLEGSVYPDGAAVASWCRFEYGPTEEYGSSVPCPATLTGGSSPEDVSSPLTGLSVGTSYHYRLVAVNAAGGISYGADKTFKTTPSVSTSGPADGVAGSPIAASLISATLTAGSSPTGTITFRVFGPQSSPPSTCTSGGTTVGTASVNGNGAYQPSAAFTPSAPGDYWWYATYSGDAGDEPAASTCGPLMAHTAVVAASPTLSASAPATATAGSPISAPRSRDAGGRVLPDRNDHLHGIRPAVLATQLLHLRRRDGRRRECLRQRFLPAIGRLHPASAGDYWWYASYGGDASDNPAASVCGR